MSVSASASWILSELYGAWHNGISFDLNNLEALMNVDFEANEWMTTHSCCRAAHNLREASGLPGASCLLYTGVVSRGCCEVAGRWSLSRCSLLIQHRSNRLVERRHFVLHDVPDDFRIQTEIFMNQNVAKSEA